MTHKQRQEFNVFMYLMKHEVRHSIGAHDKDDNLYVMLASEDGKFLVYTSPTKYKAFKTPGKAILYFVHKRRELRKPIKPNKPKKDK